MSSPASRTSPPCASPSSSGSPSRPALVIGRRSACVAVAAPRPQVILEVPVQFRHQAGPEPGRDLLPLAPVPVNVDNDLTIDLELKRLGLDVYGSPLPEVMAQSSPSGRIVYRSPVPELEGAKIAALRDD